MPYFTDALLNSSWLCAISSLLSLCSWFEADFSKSSCLSFWLVSTLLLKYKLFKTTIKGKRLVFVLHFHHQRRLILLISSIWSCWLFFHFFGVFVKIWMMRILVAKRPPNHVDSNSLLLLYMKKDMPTNHSAIIINTTEILNCLKAGDGYPKYYCFMAFFTKTCWCSYRDPVAYLSIPFVITSDGMSCLGYLTNSFCYI